MKHLWWLVIVSPGGWCEARQAETVDWRRPEIILIIEKWRKPTLHIVCVRPATPRRHSDHSPRTVYSVAGACSDLLELFSGALLW